MKMRFTRYVLLVLLTIFYSRATYAQSFDLIPQVVEVNEDESVVIDPFLDVFNITGYLDYSITGVVDVFNGTFAINVDPPTVTYSPDLNFNGSEIMVVTGCVNEGTICEDVEIFITIVPVPDNPIAGDDTTATYHITPVAINVLEDDIDIDGDGLDVSIVDDGAHGTAIYLGDSMVQYTPEFGYLGLDIVTYRICVEGSDVFCDFGFIVINILTNNFNKPVANPDFVTWFADSLVTIAPTTNDFDGDADALQVTELIMGGAMGTATITGPNAVEYEAPFEGVDSFLYVVCDLNAPQYCDTTFIKVTLSEKPVVIPDIHVPDSFSPNNDNINETLEIVGLESYASFQLTIYNRWNDVVYENDDFSKMWDGTANTGIMATGKEVPEGTYFYILELQGKADPLRGFIVLKR